MRDIRGRPSGGRGILHYAGAAENVEPTTNETVGDDKKELVEWEIRVSMLHKPFTPWVTDLVIICSVIR